MARAALNVGRRPRTRRDQGLTAASTTKEYPVAACDYASGRMTAVTPPLPPIPSGPNKPAAPPSLWRDLASGSAGWGVRLLANLAVAAALGGLVPILAYFLAALNRDWNRYASTSAVSPHDEVVAFLLVVAAAAFLAATAWLWSRSGRRRALLTPVVLSIGVIAATISLGVMAEANLRGDSEMVVGGIIALGGAGLIVIWLDAHRRRGPKWRALHNQQDGLPDVRCPACDYRMVGLTESRCPECGTEYTLDELIAKQGFAPDPDAKPQAAENYRGVPVSSART